MRHFSAENLQARKEWVEIFSVDRIKYCQPKTLYPAKKYFRNNADITTFPDKQKQRELIITTPAVQEMLNAVIQM